jgi:hypothetical protein
LDLPLQQVLQQDLQPALQFAPLALAHVLDLLRDVLDVRLIESPCPKQRGIALSPLEEVAIVELRRSHTVILVAQQISHQHRRMNR